MIEQTKTKPQETLEFKMNKQMQTFSFSQPINLVEEGKWLLGVTSFECTNSVFNINNEKNRFSISTLGDRISEVGEEFINKLNRMFKARSEYDIEFHVDQVKKEVIKWK